MPAAYFLSISGVESYVATMYHGWLPWQQFALWSLSAPYFTSCFLVLPFLLLNVRERAAASYFASERGRESSVSPSLPRSAVPRPPPPGAPPPFVVPPPPSTNAALHDFSLRIRAASDSVRMGLDSVQNRPNYKSKDHLLVGTTSEKQAFLGI